MDLHKASMTKEDSAAVSVPTCRERSGRWLSGGHVKHVAFTACYAGLVYVNVRGLTKLADTAPHAESDVDRYGFALFSLLVVLRYSPINPFVFCVFNCLGLTLFSLFPPKPRLQRSPLLGPFVCFRVVTRGLFPQLVRASLVHNLAVCRAADFHNFLFQVVTDTPLNLPQMSRVREVVVPAEYRTSRGALFKARALQYCLDHQADVVADDDWIVHLDEETLLTEDGLVGVINFACEGRHHFGQGVITYSQPPVVNWLTTLSDTVRVGCDYGSLRFTFKALHKPFFSWKGSFIVANAAAEKAVSYDHGPEGSIAEDCYFSAVAFQQGYSFGFVEGEMQEKSTFTFKDYVQQRRRWNLGIYLTAKSPRIPFRYKVGQVFMAASGFLLPFCALNIPLAVLYPLSMPYLYYVAGAFVTATLNVMMVAGVVKSFSPRRYGVAGCAVLCACCFVVPLLTLVLEAAASLLAFWWPSPPHFYIVKKELNATPLVSVV